MEVVQVLGSVYRQRMIWQVRKAGLPKVKHALIPDLALTQAIQLVTLKTKNQLSQTFKAWS